MLPNGYKEWIDRVSSLVEYAYPFEGTDGEKRYKDWLYKNGVWEKEYIKEACDVGTFVHLQMEHYINGDEQDLDDNLYSLHKNEIEGWLNWMKNLRDMETEVYCRDENEKYQWSIDMLWTNEEWKRILVDWKTWGVAKKKFNLNNWCAKPYDKLKKVALQMSLYAKALWNVDEIWVVWLHEKGTFAYKLEKVEDDVLEELILRFQTRNLQLAPDVNLTINYKPMEIKIQTTIPNNPYSVACVTLEAADIDNGKTVEENIALAISYQKTLVGKYTK